MYQMLLGTRLALGLALRPVPELPEIPIRKLKFEWSRDVVRGELNRELSLDFGADPSVPIENLGELMAHEDEELSPWRVIGKLEGTYDALLVSVREGNAQQAETQRLVRDYATKQEAALKEVNQNVEAVGRTVREQNSRIGKLEKWREEVEKAKHEGGSGKEGKESKENTLTASIAGKITVRELAWISAFVVALATGQFNWVMKLLHVLNTISGAIGAPPTGSGGATP